MNSSEKLSAKINKKLASKHGESLSEVLVALLISSLALVMLAGMVGASARMLSDSRRNVIDYVAAENALAEQGESSLSGELRLSNGYGTLKLYDEAASAYVDVLYYTMDYSDDTIVSYRADD